MKKKGLLLVLAIISVIAIGAISASAASESDLSYSILMGSATITGCDKAASGELVIPSSLEGYPVRSIESEAFSGCRNLTSITIPDTVTRISLHAFKDCTGLTSVHITDIEAWCNIDFGYFSANPLYYAKNLYLNGELVTELNIPDDIEEIKDYAFSGCTSLKSVTIPGTVTSIDYEAFSFSGLTGIIIPDSVTYMGNGAFYICNNLTDVEIGNGVTNIGNHTFGYCLNLKSITIGSSVTNVEDLAFYFCNELERVNYKGTVTNWKKLSIGYGNEPLTNATIHYIDCTKTNISDDGKTFTITPKYIENGKTVILALYDGNKFVEVQILAYTGDAIPSTTDKTYTRVKVMVWNNITGIEPVCTVEIVK